MGSFVVSASRISLVQLDWLLLRDLHYILRCWLYMWFLGYYTEYREAVNVYILPARFSGHEREEALLWSP